MYICLLVYYLSIPLYYKLWGYKLFGFFFTTVYLTPRTIASYHPISLLPFTAEFLERIMYIHSAPKYLLGSYTLVPLVSTQVILRRPFQTDFIYTPTHPPLSLYLPYFLLFFILLITTSHIIYLPPSTKMLPPWEQDFVLLTIFGSPTPKTVRGFYKGLGNYLLNISCTITFRI